MEKQHRSTAPRVDKKEWRPSGVRSRILCASLLFGFVVLFGRIGSLVIDDIATSAATVLDVRASVSPHTVAVETGEWIDRRGSVYDRHGRLLATDLDVEALFIDPGDITDTEAAMQCIREALPGIDVKRLATLLSGARYVRVAQRMTPRQSDLLRQCPRFEGMEIIPARARVYPSAHVFAHVLGGSRTEHETRIVGVAGVELEHDEALTAGIDLKLTVDRDSQALVRTVLDEGMRRFRAKGASAVVMEIETGEILSLVSLPDYNPHFFAGASDAHRFNLALQGAYEFGSALKPLTYALALEIGAADIDTVFHLVPQRIGGFVFEEPYIRSAKLTFEEGLARSSNLAMVQVQGRIARGVYRAHFEKLGILDRVSIGLPGAARPLVQNFDKEVNRATMAIGHGVSTTLVQLASAFATLAGDGRRVSPTLLAERQAGHRPQVVSPETASLSASIAPCSARGSGKRAQ